MRSAAAGLLLILLWPDPVLASSRPAPAAVSTCFTPGPESCAEQIADRIDEARSSVRVQAYYLTQPLILRADEAAARTAPPAMTRRPELACVGEDVARPAPEQAGWMITAELAETE